ncbi:MAG TPA: prepilin-type N-terminal cleavage/methylation domain-containing protein, partial [Rubrivivax sp.]|nr:prepilin-type N-terminal cleavage/methylation domain-containing protein [Rubrivivax sp.]
MPTSAPGNSQRALQGRGTKATRGRCVGGAEGAGGRLGGRERTGRRPGGAERAGKRPPGTLRADRRARGFTLVELLIVIAIVAVSAGLMTLALRDSTASRLEEEGARLAALLEMARAEARV